MAIYYASVSNFSLTSTWTVAYNGSYYSIAVAPNTDSADKTFNFTGIPVGSTINSATLTATMNSPSTGAAIRTVDGGAFSGSKGVSITPGGYNTFRFRFKANGSASAPTGVKSSTLSFSDVTVTVDYNPPGGGSSGGGAPPPAQAPYIGGLSATPSTVTAGAQIYVSIGASDGNLTRHVTVYRADTMAYLATIVASYGIEAGAWFFTIPVSWCSIAPNDTQFTILIEHYAQLPGGAWGGVIYQTVNVLVPGDAIPTVGSFTAAYNANGVNGAITKYVQNYSKVNLAMGSVSGVYGSSIVSYEITGGGFSAWNSSATLGPFSQSGDITITAKVVDSRGRVGLKTVAINVEPYSAVSVNNLQAYRSDASKNPADEGAFATLIGKIVFSSIGGQNVGTIKGRVYEKGTAAPGWTTMADNTLVLFGGGLSVEKAYTAEISINDLITSYLYSVDIPTGTVIMGIAPNGDGVSFGTYPEAGKIKSVWPIVAPGMPPNPNLLDNWYFRNPVNQRGASGFIDASTPGYGIDRWIFVGAYVNSGNVSIYPQFGCYLEQKLEPIYQALYGKTVTVSMYTNVGYISARGVFPASGPLYLSLTPDDLWRVELISDKGDGCPAIRCHVLQNPNAIYAIKLELGTASTLHLDPPADYGVELAKCQRYLRKIPSIGNMYSRFPLGISPSASYFEFVVPLGVTMRIMPTMSVFGTFDCILAQTGGAVSTITSIVMQTSASGPDMVSIIVYPSSTLSVGSVYFIQAAFDNSAHLLFSAEL